MEKIKTEKFSTSPYRLRVDKPWGWELIFTPAESRVVGKLLHLKAGCRFSFQYHNKKRETLILLSGRAKIILENSQGKIEEKEMKPKKGYFIRPFQRHRCQAITAADILEASTKEKGTTVRIEDDYHRRNETEKDRRLARVLPHEKK